MTEFLTGGRYFQDPTTGVLTKEVVEAVADQAAPEPEPAMPEAPAADTPPDPAAVDDSANADQSQKKGNK